MVRVTNLLEDVEFRERGAHAQPLYVDAHGRLLRFALKPGQRIEEHRAPGTPLYVVVVQGHGVFTGGDGVEVEVGPNSLLIFDPGEKHSVRAKDEEFVFLGILHGVPGSPEGKTGGILGRE